MRRTQMLLTLAIILLQATVTGGQRVPRTLRRDKNARDYVANFCSCVRVQITPNPARMEMPTGKPVALLMETNCG